MLLPLEPAHMRFRRARYAYDVTGMRALRRVARRTRPTGTQILGWCEDLLDALSHLSQAGVPHAALILDPRFVFVTQNKRLRFACAPVEDERLLERHTPLALLESWCGTRRCGKDRPYDVFVNQRLREYVQSEGETLSLNRFRVFVQGCRCACERLNEQPGLTLVFEDSSRLPVPLEEGGSYLVGRGAECDVCIADQPRVSRRHVTLRRDGDVVFATDMGSTNGTALHGSVLRPFEPVALPLGQPFVLAGVLTCRVIKKGA